MKNVIVPWLIAGVSLISLVVVLLNHEECTPCATPMAAAPAVAPEPCIAPPSAPRLQGAELQPLTPPVQNLPVLAATQKPAPPAAQPKTLDIALTSEVQPIRLNIRAGQLIAGASQITVREGQSIELTVIADKIGELYLEGYEISTALYPNQRTVVAFKTDMTGTFKYVHTVSGNTLGVLTVLPVN